MTMTAPRRNSVTDLPQRQMITGNLILCKRQGKVKNAFIIGQTKLKMIANLKYNLDNPEDKMAHLRAVKSLELALCLWEIRSMRRDNYETADQVFDRLDEFFNNYNIIMDELIT